MNKTFIPFIIALFLLPIMPGRASAQETKPIHQIGFDLRPYYLTPTSGFFKGDGFDQEPQRKALSAHLKYAFRFSKDSRLGQMYPHAYQGIGLSYNTFFNASEIGNPVALYAFQGSRIARLSPKLTLDYEWNFGASFGWKKYNSESNPRNDVVGSKINAYINLGFLLNYRLNPQWHLTAGVDFTHYSNGNTNYPNSGVNPVGGRIGVVRTFGNGEEGESHRKTTGSNLLPRFNYDVVLYGATRKKGYFNETETSLIPGSFGVIGLNISPMYNFNKYFRAGVSLDAQYDESANITPHRVPGTYDENMKFYRPPFREQFAVGLSLRGELVMPIFSVNVGIGRNVICQGEDTEVFYQILALKASITRHVFLHMGYQLSKFKDPNNLMLGMGYRFFSGKRK